jgi:hypothetical protein
MTSIALLLPDRLTGTFGACIYRTVTVRWLLSVLGLICFAGAASAQNSMRVTSEG